MIAIPNMNMPKSCIECHWYYECYDERCTLGKFLLRKYPTDVSEEPYILDTQRHPKCPLIEIIEDEYAKDILEDCYKITVCANYGNLTERWVNVGLIGERRTNE